LRHAVPRSVDFLKSQNWGPGWIRTLIHPWGPCWTGLSGNKHVSHLQRRATAAVCAFLVNLIVSGELPIWRVFGALCKSTLFTRSRPTTFSERR
jgi:hypothetical protein